MLGVCVCVCVCSSAIEALVQLVCSDAKPGASPWRSCWSPSEVVNFRVKGEDL